MGHIGNLECLHQLVDLPLFSKLVVWTKIKEGFPHLANELVKAEVPVPIVKPDVLQ